METKDLNYYVKFIFSSEDNEFCFSTTDRAMLPKCPKPDTDKQAIDYKIGDIIYFEKATPFKIKDIWIRQLLEDLELLEYGVDSQDCTCSQGIVKKFLFTIQITVVKL